MPPLVIFFYEDAEDKHGNKKYGGRSRNIQSDFIGNAKLKSLQSDGCNVYTYPDDKLVDIEHLCCMAHARAKFKYVLNYLHTFWEQILAYRNDGEYSIDNMAALKTCKQLGCLVPGLLLSPDTRIKKKEEKTTKIFFRWQSTNNNR